MATLLDDPTAAALIARLGDDYRLEREIARGGMGIVYLAVDVRLDRRVAIKTLQPHRAADPDVRARFLREARTAAGLSHANIVPIHQGTERDGMAWFVMGYVDGPSLADVIAREGPLPPERLVRTLLDVCRALEYAHARGVVHRDIKAENVLLDDERRAAMLTDFGIARVNDMAPMTATGAVLGTVQYMSPEQVAGDALDGRSDLYAVGVLAYFALSGRFPFERSTAPAILLAHVRDPVPPISSPHYVGDGLSSLIMQLLAKEPRARPATATMVMERLQRVETRAARVPGSVAPDGVESSQRLATVEANAVWRRAAELQADTQAGERPAQFAAAAPPEPGRGFARDDVRDAAMEAGIPARHVDRALNERDASRRGTGVARAGADTGTNVSHPLAGAPMTVIMERVIERELTDDELEDVIDELRRSYDDVGAVSMVGRTLTYISGGDPRGKPATARRIQVIVTMRRGRTTIRATEWMSALAGGLFGGIVGGLGAGAGFALQGVVFATLHGGVAMAAVLPAVLGGSYGLARWLFVRGVRRREDQMASALARIMKQLGEP
jgi:serine/threonine-protein kinase